MPILAYLLAIIIIIICCSTFIIVVITIAIVIIIPIIRLEYIHAHCVGMSCEI